jgi:hypothetical protein
MTRYHESDAEHYSREWAAYGGSERQRPPSAYLGPFPVPWHRTVEQVDRAESEFGSDPEAEDRNHLWQMRNGSALLLNAIRKQQRGGR